MRARTTSRTSQETVISRVSFFSETYIGNGSTARAVVSGILIGNQFVVQGTPRNASEKRQSRCSGGMESPETEPYSMEYRMSRVPSGLLRSRDSKALLRR